MQLRPWRPSPFLARFSGGETRHSGLTGPESARIAGREHSCAADVHRRTTYVYARVQRAVADRCSRRPSQSHIPAAVASLGQWRKRITEVGIEAGGGGFVG